MKKHVKRLSILLCCVSLALLFTTSCPTPVDEHAGNGDGNGGGNIEPEATYGFCEAQLTHRELFHALCGSLVTVGTYSEKGYSSAGLISDLIHDIVLNGLRFAFLHKCEIRFAEDFAEFKAGDFIPYNVFDYKSFITNVKIEIDGLNVRITYDP